MEKRGENYWDSKLRDIQNKKPVDDKSYGEWKARTLEPWNRKTGYKYREFTNSSSIDLKEVYTEEDLAKDHLKQTGMPGEYPYTRGIYPNMYRGRQWTMRMFSGFGTPEDTNKRLKYLI